MSKRQQNTGLDRIAALVEGMKADETIRVLSRLTESPAFMEQIVPYMVACKSGSAVQKEKGGEATFRLTGTCFAAGSKDKEILPN